MLAQTLQWSKLRQAHTQQPHTRFTLETFVDVNMPTKPPLTHSFTNLLVTFFTSALVLTPDPGSGCGLIGHTDSEEAYSNRRWCCNRRWVLSFCSFHGTLRYLSLICLSTVITHRLSHLEDWKAKPKRACLQLHRLSQEGTISKQGREVRQSLQHLGTLQAVCATIQSISWDFILKQKLNLQSNETNPHAQFMLRHSNNSIPNWAACLLCWNTGQLHYCSVIRLRYMGLFTEIKVSLKPRCFHEQTHSQREVFCIFPISNQPGHHIPCSQYRHRMLSSQW